MKEDIKDILVLSVISVVLWIFSLALESQIFVWALKWGLKIGSVLFVVAVIITVFNTVANWRIRSRKKDEIQKEENNSNETNK